MTEIEITNLALAEIGEAQITAFTDLSNINLETMFDKTRDEILSILCPDFAKKRVRLTAAGILDCSAKTITFVAGTPDTITDSGTGFVTGGFVAGDKVNIEGTTSNNTAYKVTTVAAGTLTLETFEAVVAEALVNDTDLKLYAQPAYNWSFKYAKPSDSIRILAVNETYSETADPNWDTEGDYIVTSEIDDYDQITILYIKQETDPTKFSNSFIDLLVKRLASKLALTIANDKLMRESLASEYKTMLLDLMAIDGSSGNPDNTRKDTSWQTTGR
jgi:hypothetical protein